MQCYLNYVAEPMLASNARQTSQVCDGRPILKLIESNDFTHTKIFKHLNHVKASRVVLPGNDLTKCGDFVRSVRIVSKKPFNCIQKVQKNGSSPIFSQKGAVNEVALFCQVPTCIFQDGLSLRLWHLHGGKESIVDQADYCVVVDVLFFSKETLSVAKNMSVPVGLRLPFFPQKFVVQSFTDNKFMK